MPTAIGETCTTHEQRAITTVTPIKCPQIVSHAALPCTIYTGRNCNLQRTLSCHYCTKMDVCTVPSRKSSWIVAIHKMSILPDIAQPTICSNKLRKFYCKPNSLIAQQLYSTPCPSASKDAIWWALVSPYSHHPHGVGTRERKPWSSEHFALPLACKYILCGLFTELMLALLRHRKIIGYARLPLSRNHVHNLRVQ